MKHKTSISVMIFTCIYFHIIFTQQQLPFMQTAQSKSASKKPQMPSSEINPYLQKLVKELQALPSSSKPKDIKYALTLIIKGSQVWKLLSQEKFYDACCCNNFKPHETKILKLALNSKNSYFWNQIKNNNIFKKNIELCKVPFTKEACISARYNIFFRMTYARIYLDNEAILLQLKQTYQRSLIALSWYLFAQAIIQDGLFTSGMITIKDPKHALFKYIDGYAELVSPQYRFYSGLHPHSLLQTEAYTRVSGYYKSQKYFNDAKFGIDLKDAQGKHINAFPCNNSHLMFGMLQNGLTFVTWEKLGTTINFAQKDFSALKRPLMYLKRTKKDDTLPERKEKTPQDVTLMFRSLYPTKLLKQQTNHVRNFGISAMRKILPNDNLELFDTHLIKNKKYQPETLHLRKGNEIILRPSIFVSFA